MISRFAPILVAIIVAVGFIFALRACQPAPKSQPTLSPIVSAAPVIAPIPTVTLVPSPTPVLTPAPTAHASMPPTNAAP